METGSDHAGIRPGGAAVKGTTLWFDEAKHHGFVLTDDGERLRVDRDGSSTALLRVGRCARRPVNLSVGELDGEGIAVDVSLVPDE
jgi:hypothetical protein